MRRLTFTLLITANLSALFAATTQTATQSIDVTISPAMKVSVPASFTLFQNGGGFQDYTGNLTVSFKARTGTTTSVSAGMRVSQNFTPSGGPSAAAGNLKYVCGSPTLGTACSGTNTASTVSSQPVITMPSLACTGGGAPCSAADPNTFQLMFSLANLPTYSTGTYSGQIQFTISAL